MKSLVMIFLFSSLLNQGEASERDHAGYDMISDDISAKYEAGAYLMYDCEEKHWVCVLEEYYKICEAKRVEDLELKKYNLRCAGIGALPTKKSCFQRALYMSSHNFSTRFCLHPIWQDKELELSGR
jgi:hypothetical protein